MNVQPVFVSLVSPIEAVSGDLPGFLREASELLARHYENFEIVRLVDAAAAEIGNTVSPLLGEIPCIRLLTMARPVGPEMVLFAGLEASIGDFVTVVRPGIDPLREVPEMVARAVAGADLVLGIARWPEKRGALHRAARRVFVHGIAPRLDIPLVPGATSFSVLSRQAVNAMTRVRQRHRYYVAQSLEACASFATHPFVPGGVRAPPPRSLLDSIVLALDVLVNHSRLGLRYLSALSLVGAFFTLVYVAYVAIVNLVRHRVMEGWTTLSLQMSGLFLLLFVRVAMLAEYVHRIASETTERPLYLLKKELQSNQMTPGDDRLNVVTEALSPPVRPPQDPSLP